MASNGASKGDSRRQPLLQADDGQRISSDDSLPDKSDSRVARALWRLRSPSSQAKDLAQSGKSMPLSPQFEQKSAGTTILVKALIGLALYLLVGIICFSLLQDELHGATTTTLVDAMYFAIVTMTTVGYGDLVPRGVEAKLFTCAFVFVGFGLVGVLVASAANYLVKKQETMLVKKFHQHISGEIREDEDVVAAKWKVAVSGAMVMVLFVVGVLVLMFCEGFNFIDAFYCACVTVTTLGYGDETFTTEARRVFAVFWILSSTVCVAQFFLFLAESRMEERQSQIAVWALSWPTMTSDLEAADLNHDGAVKLLYPDYYYYYQPVFRWGEHVGFQNWFTVAGIGAKETFYCSMTKRKESAHMSEDDSSDFEPHRSSDSDGGSSEDFQVSALVPCCRTLRIVDRCTLWWTIFGNLQVLLLKQLEATGPFG